MPAFPEILWVKAFRFRAIYSGGRNDKGELAAPDCAAAFRGENMTEGNMPGGDIRAADVVSLLERMGGTISFPPLDVIEDHWIETGGRDGVPSRAQVDPRRLGSALRCAFVLERLAPRITRLRVTGAHLTDLHGCEVRGMPFAGFFGPDTCTEIAEVIERVLLTPGRARLTLSGDRSPGKPPLDGQFLLLPLKDDRGEVSRVLGCLSTLGATGRTPRRFAIRKTEFHALPSGAFRPIAPHRPPVNSSKSPIRPIGRPDLRLVKSDD